MASKTRVVRKPRPAASARPDTAGWAEAARAMHAASQDRLLDALTATRFDDKDWNWQRSGLPPFKGRK